MTAFFALIPAAGTGTRMASAQPKQYLQVAGRQVLRHVLDTFAASAAIAHVYVVVAEDDTTIDALMAHAPHLTARVTVLRTGGATRARTVHNALQALHADCSDADWILVHDAARPGLTTALIDRLIAALRDDAVGGLLALPVVDTIKRADGSARSIETVPRADLWTAQTPQMFRYRLLCDALAQPGTFTDEAGAVEALGLQPKLVPGSARNFKLTLPDDIALAALYLAHPA
ncbi:MAG: 2-C-methyl-D-erythritol 4-phosphate cytidylyltransferase [Herminiimonas sp.]|nr:2-C-methyl-D-erythritol 4-phosphate cytidylyltransferase [Herminiimonas sp.]